jgi:hypothetical protein
MSRQKFLFNATLMLMGYGEKTLFKIKIFKFPD